MRQKLSLLLILAGLGASGCLRSTTTIEVRPDGSGTIVQENAVSAQTLAMLKGFASGMGQNAKDSEPPPELFSEGQARKTAETMGVTFVSGEPFKLGELEGYRARYSFDDIARIKVNMQQAPEGMSSGAKQPPFGFTLARGASSSVLTIQMPEQTPGTSAIPGVPGGGPTEADKAKAAQALAMMKMMMKGMFVDVSLAVDGRIIKSNAPHVDGSKITLLQLDFDQLLADEAAMARLEAAKDLKGLANIPGLKIASEPKLVIEFSR